MRNIQKEFSRLKIILFAYCNKMEILFPIIFSVSPKDERIILRGMINFMPVSGYFIYNTKIRKPSLFHETKTMRFTRFRRTRHTQNGKRPPLRMDKRLQSQTLFLITSPKRRNKLTKTFKSLLKN